MFTKVVRTQKSCYCCLCQFYLFFNRCYTFLWPLAYLASGRDCNIQIVSIYNAMIQAIYIPNCFLPLNWMLTSNLSKTNNIYTPELSFLINVYKTATQPQLTNPPDLFVLWQRPKKLNNINSTKTQYTALMTIKC